MDGTELNKSSENDLTRREATDITSEWLKDTLVSFNRMSEFKQDKKNLAFDVKFYLEKLITSSNESLVSDKVTLSDFLTGDVSSSQNREELLSAIIPEVDKDLFGLRPTEIETELKKRKEEFLKDGGYESEWPYGVDYLEGKHFYLSVPTNIRGANYVINLARGDGGIVGTSEYVVFKYGYQEE